MAEPLPCTKEFLLRRLDPEYIEPPNATHHLESHEIGDIFGAKTEPMLMVGLHVRHCYAWAKIVEICQKFKRQAAGV